MWKSWARIWRKSSGLVGYILNTQILGVSSHISACNDCRWRRTIDVFNLRIQINVRIQISRFSILIDVHMPSIQLASIQHSWAAVDPCSPDPAFRTMTLDLQPASASSWIKTSWLSWLQCPSADYRLLSAARRERQEYVSVKECYHTITHNRNSKSHPPILT